MIIANKQKKGLKIKTDKVEIKILLVDDREDNLFSIEAILEKDQYKFVKANSGRNALKILLKEHDFSLILMDVQMPDLNGYETAGMIYEREKLRHIPIIFITAHNYNEEQVFKGYKAGAVDYIYKPINSELLKTKVSIFIELYKKNHQLLAQEQKLIAINNELEKRVKLRTEEFESKNLELESKNLELKKTNNDLDNFIYTASHDLKAPIANLEALISVLDKKLKGRIQENERALFDMIGISISKFNKTISDLTEITKVQKIADDEMESVSFEEISEDVKIDIQKLIHDSKVNLEEEYQVDAIIYAKKNIRSIFYNFMSNALKYRASDRKAELKIRSYQKDGYIILEFEDNGLGIIKEQQSKLFTMFKRFHSHVEGSGIGLYIVKRIIENNGGKIEVDSEVGRGTTFKIFFPISQN